MALPERQILTEEQLRALRKTNLERLMFGDWREIFEEWLLRGEPQEEIDPTGAIAVFPVPLPTGEIDVEIQVFARDDINVEDFYRQVSDLGLPEDALVREAFEFRDMPLTGEQMLGYAAPTLIGNGLPAVVLVFSDGDKPVTDQSVYLLAPTIVPPSIALRLAQERLPRYAGMDVVGREKTVLPEPPEQPLT